MALLLTATAAVAQPAEPEAPEEPAEAPAPAAEPAPAETPAPAAEPAPEDPKPTEGAAPAEKPASPNEPEPAEEPAPTNEPPPTKETPPSATRASEEREVAAPAEVSATPPPPLPPPPLFPSQVEDERPQIGFRQGRFFLRDRDDDIRIYPGGRLRLDFGWMPDAPEIREADGSDPTAPGFAIRRVRLETSGELFHRLAFTLGAELGQTSRAPFGTSRFARPRATEGPIRPAEVTVSYRFRNYFNLTAGNQNVPFSLSNRTREFATTFTERNIAIRGFVVPQNKDLGLVAWGEIFPRRLLNYELGVFTGDGADRPFADDQGEFVGRIWSRPLAPIGDNSFFRRTQAGVSVRYGRRARDQFVDELPAITSNQGFAFWQAGYLDSEGRTTRIIGSGDQLAAGGEFLTAVDLPDGNALEFRSEAHYVQRDTREAIDGFELTNTERLGRLDGLAGYAQLSFWPCCTDAFVNGEPGVYRPYTIPSEERGQQTKRGIEVSALGGAILARYRGANRGASVPESNTPTDADITIWQVGGGVQYWWSWNFRAAVNYFAYLVPGGDNLAIVPDDLIEGSSGSVHHELVARLAASL
ncbi:MAG: porin [Myxococcota bacterium]